MLTKEEAQEFVEKRLLPPFLEERDDKLDRIDKWFRWDHDKPHQPKQPTSEYKELSARSQVPWLNLVVSTAAQNLYVDGYRGATDPTNARPWGVWQANGMDARQTPIMRAALGYGLSYASVLPGIDPITSEGLPVIKGHSPRRMMAFYRDPANDDWPEYAIQVDETKLEDGLKAWFLRLYDEEAVWSFNSDSGGTNLRYVDYEEHNLGVCPIVRFANQLDLEGRTPGEVEPLIPLAGRIDQSVFDRLVVQRFGAWVVRTISGMTAPETAEEAQSVALLLRMNDLLVAENAETTFGHIPATPLDGFIRAAESDIETLAAVSQTPMYALVGKLINLSAEALEAARASFNQKVDERKTSFGESWEQVLRLAAWVSGDTEAAQDYSSQVRWRNTKTRSLAQVADALGKLAAIEGFPVEMVFEQVPEWTQTDVDRATELAEKARSAIVTPPAE